MLKIQNDLKNSERIKFLRKNRIFSADEITGNELVNKHFPESLLKTKKNKKK